MAATPPPTRLCRRGLEKAQTASAARNGKSFRAPTVSRLDRHGSAPTLALTVRACPPCWPDPRRTGTAPCPTPATLACVYRCLRACVLARARARGAAGTKRITGRRASGRPAWPWPVGAPTRARSSATRRQGPGQRVFSHPNGSSASTFPTHTHAPPPLRTHIAPTSSTPCCPSKGHTCTLALARARRAKVTAAPHVLLPSGPTSSGDPPPPPSTGSKAWMRRLQACHCWSRPDGWAAAPTARYVTRYCVSVRPNHSGFTAWLRRQGQALCGQRSYGWSR